MLLVDGYVFDTPVWLVDNIKGKKEIKDKYTPYWLHCYHQDKKEKERKRLLKAGAPSEPIDLADDGKNWRLFHASTLTFPLTSPYH